jgi:hypothetical protein
MAKTGPDNLKKYESKSAQNDEQKKQNTPCFNATQPLPQLQNFVTLSIETEDRDKSIYLKKPSIHNAAASEKEKRSPKTTNHSAFFGS